MKLNPQINPLPADVIDKIAAGEVVERPAHMVKELLENSIDAGAFHITVEVGEGGRAVRIIDDGAGIPENELVAALERHTTSKISDFDDLARLKTFGFRGEALATIGSVSHLTLSSRPAGQENGYAVSCAFGKKEKVQPAAVNYGTVVNVSELFANVPARLKFLKSNASELAQIRYVVQAMALSHPQVEFSLKFNGELDCHYTKTDFALERARQVLQVKQFFRSEASVGNFNCSVLFASPDEVRGNSRGIWLFVQDRWVQDRGLQAAVMDAYRSLLMHGEYPNVVVYLKCEPAEVDVNVHPAKSQIRFRDSRAAFQCVHRALRAGLEDAPWGKRSVPAAETINSIPLGFTAPEFDSIVVKQKTFTSPVANYNPERLPGLGEVSALEKSGEASPNWSGLRLVGQVNSTYLVAESGSSLVLIDQHAAHERIYFERLLRNFKEGAVDIQSYLLPLLINIPAESIDALLSQAAEFRRLGIEIEQSGADSIAVRAAPAWISETALTDVLMKTAEEITDRGGSFAFEKNLNEVCARLACHSAIRAGQTLSLEEMQSLTSQMDTTKFSNYCPHGRPVMIELTWNKIERDFGRIV